MIKQPAILDSGIGVDCPNRSQGSHFIRSSNRSHEIAAVEIPILIREGVGIDACKEAAPGGHLHSVDFTDHINYRSVNALNKATGIYLTMS